MGIEEFLLDQAEKKGRKEGLEKGCKENAKETALKLKKNGLDVTLITDITGLSVKEIGELS